MGLALCYNYFAWVGAFMSTLWESKRMAEKAYMGQSPILSLERLWKIIFQFAVKNKPQCILSY